MWVNIWVWVSDQIGFRFGCKNWAGRHKPSVSLVRTAIVVSSTPVENIHDHAL